MARSILPEVRKAVVAGLLDEFADQAPTFNGVSVTYAWEGGKDDARREQVFTNNARATHQSAAMRPGRNHRDERMSFDIVVLVLAPSKKPEDTDDRAFAIGQVVEEFIADHASNELDIDGLNWIEMSGFSAQNLVLPEGSVSELIYTVNYQARLT